MSKNIIDDPWLEYLYLPGKRTAHMVNDKQRRALARRIERFKRSRRTKPFERF